MDVTDKYRWYFNMFNCSRCNRLIAYFESVGNIFTGLGLLAEVNHQLGEEGPRIGLQRLSRFVRANLKDHLFSS